MLLHFQPANKRSGTGPAKGVREFFQKFFNQIRHRKGLNAEFKKIDATRCGYITVDSLVKHIIDQFSLRLPITQESRFTTSIQYYADLYGCFKAKEGQISRYEFSTFWLKFTELYRKIDKNNGT